MSVLIKDMEKPKSCFEIIDGDFEYCPFVNTDDDCVLLLKKGICNATWKEQYSKCPLVEVLEPCEDALKKIKKASFVGSDGLDYVETLQALDALKDAIGVTLHVTKISKHCSDFSDLDEVIECEDAVSRKAVYEAMIEKGQRSRRYRLGETWELNGTEIREALDTVPSVTPKRKTGKWIEEQRGIKVTQYKCSECGRTVIDDTAHDVAEDYPFCHCGADIRGEQDEQHSV